MQVLLVEDNPGDVRLTAEALKEVQDFPTNMFVVGDGEQALTLLMNYDSNPDSELPELILLDLNLPKVNGIDILRYIRSHEKLSKIPVAVLTSSGNECDILNAHDLRANCYIKKPLTPEIFIRAVQSLD